MPMDRANAGNEASTMKLMRWTLQLVFGCRHKHLSRVFTIDNHTYRVCFDCAREIQSTVTSGVQMSKAS